MMMKYAHRSYSIKGVHGAPMILTADDEAGLFMLFARLTMPRRVYLGFGSSAMSIYWIKSHASSNAFKLIQVREV